MFFSRRSTTSGLTPILIAGIVGPIWFTTLVIIQGFLQPDYSHIAMPISALAAWPFGRIQILNFLVMGPLMAAYAIGVHRVIRPTRFGLVGIVLLLASSLGIPLHPWAGLLQRVVLAVWFPCIIVIAIRALRIVRERQLQPNATPS